MKANNMYRSFSRKKVFKRTIWVLVILFLMINVMAVFHSYKFTHFALKKMARTKDPSKLSGAGKLMTLVFGVDNPRPANDKTPSSAFQTIRLKSNKTIECWYIQKAAAVGTVILFHGYSGQKASLLEKADVFLNLGYNTMLVDFMGSGGSEGRQTTIGYFESEQVKTCYDFLVAKGEKNILLFGTSMGSVAIMKAISDFNFQPSGVIIECPFGSMYKTVCARFKLMNAPIFPMAGLLVFWGGVQNGFWAFGHNPTAYAKSISCPTLLLYGAQDRKVSREEINEMYKNFKDRKQLKIYETAGHENIYQVVPEKWTQDVREFVQ